MTRHKDILFENGTLTDATDGFDSVLGAPTRDTTSQIKGVGSMRCTAVGDFGREDFTASNSIYLSFYLKITTLPASTQSRIVFIRDGTTTRCALRLTSGGKLQLRDATGTQIGSDSATTLATATIYRIGLRYTKGTGANGILEAFVVAGDAAFGAAFASTSVDTSTTTVSRAEVGQGASGTVCDIYIDDIRIDDTTMPGPSAGVEITNTYTALAFLQKTTTNTYTAIAFIQTSPTSNYTATTIVSNQITNSYTASAFISGLVTTNYTALASILGQVTPIYTSKAIIQETKLSQYTALASLSSQVIQTYTARAVSSRLWTTQYTAITYISPVEIKRYYPSPSKKVIVTFLLCDPFGYPLYEISPNDYVSASYTLALNAVTPINLILRGDFPYNLIYHDGWILPIFQVAGNVSYVDASAVFFVQNRSRSQARMGEKYVHIDGVSGNDLFNRRVVAYDTSTAYSDKYGLSDTIAVQFVRENYGDLAVDTERNIGGQLVYQGNPNHGVPVYVEASRKVMIDTLQDIVSSAAQFGSELFYDVSLLSLGQRKLVFRTWVGARGMVRTREMGTGSIILSPNVGTLSNVVLNEDYSKSYNFIYASGKGSGNTRIVKTASDPGLIARGPFSRREIVANSNASIDAEVQDYASAVLRQSRPRLIFSADIPDPSDYGRLWKFGDKVSSEVDSRLFDAHIAVVNLNINRGVLSIRSNLRSEVTL